ncbi:MAG: HPr(Ser) kinase/phosphatase, partial [Oscillospiraceae bacterium]
PTRIQILGNAEMGYLEGLSKEERRRRLRALFSTKPPTIVITRGLEPFDEILEFAKEYGVPVLSTLEATSSFMSGVISLLSVELAQRITRHGVLVEVYGEGILILGDSGVGKSETAVELLKRGHRLIADDAVELRRVSNRTIVGQAPENIRHFIELRGIGIINVARIFGTGAVKNSEKIDLVVELEPWDKHKNYSRTGLENNTIDILGLKVPLTVIPVMPGRNLAVILEIAAINNRQKAMGYNAAMELLGQLGLKNDITGETSTLI